MRDISGIGYKKGVMQSVEDTANNTSDNMASRRRLLQALKDVSGNILTCAIFTVSENGDNILSGDQSEQLNRKMRDLLDAGYYAWFPSRRPGSGYEDVFIVYNISLEDAQRLGVEYKRKGIVWVRNVGNGISYRLLERPNGKCVFRKVCERTKVCDMDDASVIFAEFGRSFDHHLPFFERTGKIRSGILARHNGIIGRIIEMNKTRYGHDTEWVKIHLERLIENGWSGRSKYESRGILFGGYKKLCDSRIFEDMGKNDTFDLSAFPKEMLQRNYVSYSPYRLSAVHGSLFEMDRNGDFLSGGLDRIACVSEAIDDITSHFPIDAGQFIVVNGPGEHVAVLVADIVGNAEIIKNCMSQYHFLQNELFPDVKLSIDGQEWVAMRFEPTELSTIENKRNHWSATSQADNCDCL